jgi:hypothetical protein
MPTRRCEYGSRFVVDILSKYNGARIIAARDQEMIDGEQ